VERCGMDIANSGKRPMEGSYEHSIKSVGSTEGGNFFAN
jgi:hypothetical protein